MCILKANSEYGDHVKETVIPLVCDACLNPRALYVVCIGIVRTYYFIIVKTKLERVFFLSTKCVWKIIGLLLSPAHEKGAIVFKCTRPIKLSIEFSTCLIGLFKQRCSGKFMLSIYVVRYQLSSIKYLPVPHCFMPYIKCGARKNHDGRKNLSNVLHLSLRLFANLVCFFSSVRGTELKSDKHISWMKQFQFIDLNTDLRANLALTLRPQITPTGAWCLINVSHKFVIF